MYRLLIVEDDPIIAAEVGEYLRGWGYETRQVRDFSQVLREFIAFDPQLVLLDLWLPVLGGYHWCKEIRKLSTVPILFMTSASDDVTAVTAMSLGADDLIAKPFDLGVLAAKVEAMLRRAYSFSAAATLAEHRGLVFIPAEAKVQYQGNSLRLTPNENRILQTLMESRGRVVSRELLMTRLWETDQFVDDNTLTVNVGRLRAKLAELGAEGMIETRKGEGYLLP